MELFFIQVKFMFTICFLTLATVFVYYIATYLPKIAESTKKQSEILENILKSMSDKHKTEDDNKN